MGICADVILPLPLQANFTYRIPDEMRGVLQPGWRVLVPFGRKKFYTGIVMSIHDNLPTQFEVKEIAALLDSSPILLRPQLQLWQWIADYYLCSIGDVYKAAVPSGLKVESETVVTASPDYFETEDARLSDREKIVLQYVSSRPKVQLDEVERFTGFKNVAAVIMRLLEKDAIYVAERVVQSYSPKTETYVTLNCERGDNDAMNRFFDLVSRAEKQEKLLLAFIEMSQWLRHSDAIEVAKKALLQHSGISSAVFAAMIEKGIFKQYKKEVNRFFAPIADVVAPPELSSAQKKAFWDISDALKQGKITLLRGVTSSGKTEIYINLIAEMLRLGKQVLYLVPEIALTTQLTHRLQKVFGNSLIIYHSKFNDNERVDIWKKLLNSTSPCVVLGVRSSVFLPFSNLGLVVVDEEHEPSYKQQDPAPRYNARNVALVLAQMHGAKALLGSATPSMESYYNAKTGRYALVELLTRYDDIALPAVSIVNTKQERKRRTMNGIFSSALIAQCRHALDEGKQAILFQNRRGYAPMLTCRECAYTAKCQNCDVSLTYHRANDTLVCHYCGFTMPMPHTCPSCGQPTLEIVGFGTERIEDEIERVFPDVPVARMDLDTTRNKNGYDEIIDNFSSGKSKILVGTQMVTKGLDFGGVNVVGVLNADSLLNFPDFRAHERAFNMLEQVSGRAGRKDGTGHVVIQTAFPDHPILEHIINHDYEGYFNSELEDRRRFGYPPFSKIIIIYLKHRDDAVVGEMAVRFSNLLREIFAHRVLGPEPPLVARVQQFHIRQIVLKMETAASMVKVKAILRQLYERMLALDTRMKSVILYYDVDPA